MTFKNITEDIGSIAMTDAYAITKKYKTVEEFSKYIEMLAMKRGETLIDIILEYCDIHDLDEAVVAKLLSNSLKGKIHVEAVDLKLIETEDGILDI